MSDRPDLDVAPKVRVTDEWLLHARRNPTRIAAWALRAVIDELIDRRLAEKPWWRGEPR